MYRVQYVLPNYIMLLVTIEKFETNHVLVKVSNFKPYKYMEFKVHKQEQQMPMYWEHNVGGLSAKDFDMEVEDEDYVTHKPQI